MDGFLKYQLYRASRFWVSGRIVMKQFKVLLFGLLFLQPGWLLAYTSWGELSPKQQHHLTSYASYWNSLSTVQQKALLLNIASDRYVAEPRIVNKRSRIVNQRYGQRRSLSNRHNRSLRNGHRGHVTLHFGHKRHAPKRHSKSRYHSLNKRHHLGKRSGRYLRNRH